MLTRDKVIARNSIQVIGSGEKTLILAHGFGCDQNMWQRLIPELSDHYTLVLFDYVGSGKSQLSSCSPARYHTLEGYAQDVTEMCKALELADVHFGCHSVCVTSVSSLPSPSPDVSPA